MSNTYVMGRPPEKFSRKVEFKLPDGSDAAIQCDFIYRTRKQFGQLLDEVFSHNRQSDPDQGRQFETLADQTNKDNAAYLEKILSGWNLDQPLVLKSMEQLADECPAGVKAIMVKYAEVIKEGREGN